MHGAKSKRDGQGIWRDAKLIEKSMAGLGTRDTQLIYRFVLLLSLVVWFSSFFTDNNIPYFVLVDLFVLIGILSVSKLSRALINNDMGNHLRLVLKVRRVGIIRNYWWLSSSRVRIGMSEFFFFDGISLLQ